MFCTPSMDGILDGIRELATDLHAAELEHAVRCGDGQAVSRWGAICATGGCLDTRCGLHCAKGIFNLCAPPLWLAVYKANGQIADALLRAGASPDACSSPCPGGNFQCAIGGQSALHLGVMRGELDCVQRLVSLKAAPDAVVCFGLENEDDEPEWNESSGCFQGGLAGLSVLQLAALRSDETLCAVLLAHGADGAQLAHGADGAQLDIAAKLRTLRTDDGADAECAICLSPILYLAAEWTACCVKPFHAHCLKGLELCPLCRSRRRDGPRPLAPPTDAATARALQREEEEAQQLASTSSQRRGVEGQLEAALELSFRGPQWTSGGEVSTDSVMGTNYGWRTGGPTSTLFTV